MLRIVVLVLGILSAVTSAALAEETVVASAARLGEHPDHTRFVLELSQNVEYQLFSLSDPYRVVLDLPEIQWRLPADTGLTGQGLIKSFRYGVFRKGRSRVVIDLWKPAAVAAHYVLPGDDGKSVRLVLHLAPTTREAFMASAGWPANEGTKNAASAEAPSPRLIPARRPLVVVDPGHGGIDPGAQGSGGTVEKTVVLAIGLALRDALLASGRYDVLMTRDSDTIVKLPERVDMARRATADVFISLHADANPNAQIRGASVYTLSEKASDAEAARFAREENSADTISGIEIGSENDEVKGILYALAQRETMNSSVNLAHTMVGELKKATDVALRPYRYAGFRVLKAPDIPSILIEVGFLSNTDDETRLLSEEWQLKVAAAMMAAIDKSLGQSAERAELIPAAGAREQPQSAPSPRRKPPS